MVKIGIIVGSTRPGRKALDVAKWAHEILKSRKDAEFEIVDIAEYNLPLLDEPGPPSTAKITPSAGPPKSPRSTALSSSPPSTTTAPPAH